MESTPSYSRSPLARLFGLRLYMGVDNSQLHIGGVKCIKDNNQVQLYDQIRGDTATAHTPLLLFWWVARQPLSFRYRGGRHRLLGNPHKEIGARF